MAGGKSWHEGAVDGTATSVSTITHSDFHHPYIEGFNFKIHSSSTFQQLQNDTHKKTPTNQTRRERWWGFFSFLKFVSMCV